MVRNPDLHAGQPSRSAGVPPPVNRRTPRDAPGARRLLLSGLLAVGLLGAATGSAGAAIPSDPGFSKQYSLHNTGQLINGASGTADADIDAPEAWDVARGTA